MTRARDGAVRFVLSAAHHGERLDRVLVELGAAKGRAEAKRLFDEGRVRVSTEGDRSRRASKGERAVRDDVVWVADEVDDDSGAPDLVLLLERDDIVVVDKAAGVPSAPVPGGTRRTVVRALAERYPEMAELCRRPGEAGIVHRLDNDTSGALLAARTRPAFDELVDALSQDRVIKRYRLLCPDAMLSDRGTILFAVGPHPRDRRKAKAFTSPSLAERYRARPARSDYVVLERRAGFALCEVSVERALRHQIRAHFAAVGSPLAGDELYGGPPLAGLKRHALHASAIAYAGGATVAPFEAIAPWPEDLERAWRDLEAKPPVSPTTPA